MIEKNYQKKIREMVEGVVKIQQIKRNAESGKTMFI